MFFRGERPAGRTFLYTAMLSASLHVLILGLCFLYMTNPFAGGKTTVSLPAIRATLVSMADLHWTSPTASKPERRQASTPFGQKKEETPVQPPPAPSSAQAAAEKIKHVAALWGLTSGEDLSGKGNIAKGSRSGGGGTDGMTSLVAAKTIAPAGSPAKEPAGPPSVLPRYRSTPKPVYPAYARDRGQEGVVLVTTEVLANGQVGAVKLKQSSGHTLLDQSALRAVKNWSFIPARKMNAPVVSYVDIPIRFSLSDADPF